MNARLYQDVQAAIRDYKRKQELEYAQTNWYLNTISITLVVSALIFFTCVYIGWASSRQKARKEAQDLKRKTS
jgi:ABC-type maltose transport system permease subunit